MSQSYGPLHTIASFLGRCLPKRGGDDESIKHLHEVASGLERLDECQRTNRAVTLSVSAGGGIWVTHDGRRLFMIEPGQESLNTITGNPGDWLSEIYAPHIAQGTVVERLGTDRYRSWKVMAGNLDVIWSIVEGLSPPDPTDEIEEEAHPRTFPGPARQAALDAFRASGSFCPGYHRSRHHVDFDAGERIEFDHILPYSAGGASSDWNVQVLCTECNRTACRAGCSVERADASLAGREGS